MFVVKWDDKNTTNAGTCESICNVKCQLVPKTYMI